MKKTKKSQLQQKAEKFFSFDKGADVTTLPERYLDYPSEPVVVQTFTTYAVCEDPIPDYRKR